MNTNTFKAMIVKEDNGKYIREIGSKNITDLPEGEVLIKVKYSSLDYECCVTVSGFISTRVTLKPAELTSDIAERMAFSNDDASR